MQNSSGRLPLNICLAFFGVLGKRLHKKAKINFKVYDVVKLEENRYNPHITQYLQRKRQSDNEIWADNRVSFFLKSHAKNEAGGVSPGLLHEVETGDQHLSFNIFR